MPEKDSGPFLAMAVLCDSVIEGKDGVLSLIRLIDQVNVLVPFKTEPPMEAPVILTFALGFKAGNAKGTYSVRLEAEGPTGRQTHLGDVSLSFQGPPEQGANIITSLRFNFESEGLYWFNVYLENVFITRLPLRVNRHHLVPPGDSEKNQSDNKADTQPQGSGEKLSS